VQNDEDGMMALLDKAQPAWMPVGFFEKVTKIVDGGKSSNIIFLNFPKAFNKILKKRLQEEFSYY
jgi:hypothetical protein